MKMILGFLFLSCTLSYCQNKPANSFNFSEITFHSSACNGVCPDISLVINSDREIELSRTVFKGKGIPDTSKSGSYKGTVNNTQYKKLIALLSEIDWEDVTFPDVKCCDKPIKTIILYYNDKNKKLKSMEPAASTKKLIDYLTELGETIKLPPHDTPIDFEVVE